MTKIYLSGASKNIADEGQGWRDKAEELLDCEVFNPNKHYNYSTLVPSSDKACMSLFFYHLATSDIILVNLDDTDKSVGTGFELGFALSHSKQIIGFGNKNTYGWAVEACDYVADDLEAAAEYIRIHY